MTVITCANTEVLQSGQFVILSPCSTTVKVIADFTETWWCDWACQLEELVNFW